MRRLWTALLAAAALASAAAAPLPPLTGPVVDTADILSPQAEAALSAKLAALKARTGRQFVVVSLASLGDETIEQASTRLSDGWRLGEPRNDGLMLVIAPNDGTARVHIGCGLGDIVSDALATKILDEQAIPFYEKGDLEGGTVAAAEALIAQLELPDEEAKARASQAGPPDELDEYCARQMKAGQKP